MALVVGTLGGAMSFHCESHQQLCTAHTRPADRRSIQRKGEIVGLGYEMSRAVGRHAGSVALFRKVLHQISPRWCGRVADCRRPFWTPSEGVALAWRNPMTVTLDDPHTVPPRFWHLDDMLDTLVYLRRETDVWFEITTLLIPGRTDSDAEIAAERAWIPGVYDRPVGRWGRRRLPVLIDRAASDPDRSAGIDP